MRNKVYSSALAATIAQRPAWTITVLFALVSLAGVFRLPAGDGALGGRAKFDEDLSAYKQTEASGAVAALQQRIERGETKLNFEPAHGYLLALLRELNVPVSSQVLVASKTSPNRALISPRNPRALYFSPEVSFAYVPSAPLLEVASWDQNLGVVFYTLDQKTAPQPRLRRDDRCLECHASAKTLNVPGLLVRSFVTKEDGDADVLSGIMVNHRTPLAARWGGYYVTGTSGAQPHRGNLFGRETVAGPAQNPAGNSNITDLKSFLDTGKYPAPGSDIVALLVHDHQVHLQNLLTRLKHEAGNATSESSLRDTYPTVEALLQYLLFIEEPHLLWPVRVSSEFSHGFEALGPKDSQGRSLRQFDLQEHLFKFPCSFMIYSAAFDTLPYPVRRHFYHRLWEILSGEDRSPEYKSLAADTRKAILEILIATKPGLPAYWRL